MEISVLILSCVILGLNLVLPVLLYFFNFTICNLIWILPNKIHTYIHTYPIPLNLIVRPTVHNMKLSLPQTMHLSAHTCDARADAIFATLKSIVDDGSYPDFKMNQ